MVALSISAAEANTIASDVFMFISSQVLAHQLEREEIFFITSELTLWHLPQQTLQSTSVATPAPSAVTSAPTQPTGHHSRAAKLARQGRLKGSALIDW